MRLLSVFLVVLSTLSGLHGSAVETSLHEQYHQQLTLAASHAFHAMQSSTTVPGVSAACQSSIDAIVNDPTVVAAKQSTTQTGCVAVDTKNPSICAKTETSTTLTINCVCVETTNLANVTAAVQALNGKLCPLSLSVGMTANGNGRTANLQIQQSGGAQIYGPQCTSQDIQSSLDASVNAGFDQVRQVLGSTNGVTYTMNVQVKACSQTSSKNLSSGAGMIGISWFSMVCVAVMSSLMMISL